jgi:hypothetical protein
MDFATLGCSLCALFSISSLSDGFGVCRILEPYFNVAPLIRIQLLLLLAGLLLLAAVRTPGQAPALLVLGAAFSLAVVCLGLFRWRRGRMPSSGLIITLYLLALGCLGLGVGQSEDWYPHVAQALLLLVPVMALAMQWLNNSGAPVRRRASRLSRQMAGRKDWPLELTACRDMPEVKAFREACLLDATPALHLLHHARLPVRLAALTALEDHRHWRRGQAEFVLQIARSTDTATLRAAAVLALTHLDDRLMVEALANFLLDPNREVRQATLKALVWEIEHHWSWIRHAIREYLAHPAFQEDAPLKGKDHSFPQEALADLNAWATEKGLLAVRAAQTLGSYYAHVLEEQPEEALTQRLQCQAADLHTPGALRLELARLLLRLDKAPPQLLESLLEPVHPSSLRLLAAEALLSRGTHAQAQATLYDVARLANREIALATALVVQRCLGVDLGLPQGQPLPDVHSRLAAEVTRRVLLWASQAEGRGLRSDASLSIE